MRTEVYESFSPEETFALGVRMGRESRPGDILLLNGELGVGKTVFAKGLGKGLSITEPIVSPTFTIMQVYSGGALPLYHFDVYRIADSEEMEEIGYEEYFYGQGVTLIEWAERIADILPEKRISVTIKKELEKGTDYRNILVEWRQA